MAIKILPANVASQIAAGEVVERPASVVKELVENSIDAGARKLRVETEAGGIRRIRVDDDGSGVPSKEVELAFMRHATSKLSSAEDLSHITTLGFRGEALASIAAVSRMSFETRTAADPAGTSVRLEAGTLHSRTPSGRPSGTSVTVSDLFFNLPVRRKFLRSERTERGHIDRWLTRYAMAYPNTSFEVVHSGRTTFQSVGNGRLRDVLISVYGLEIGASAIEIAPERNPSELGIEVSGLVCPPAIHRANRAYITLFVNGRWISDSQLTYAVVQAYHTFLPGGRYPLAVVMLRLPPEDVDVNVHPAKAQVRFTQSDSVFRAVQKAVRRTLLELAPVPTVSTAAGLRSGASDTTWSTVHTADMNAQLQRLESKPRHLDAGLERSPQLPQLDTVQGRAGPRPAGGRLPPLRVIGQVGTTYIVAEGPDGIYLIDQHAAHERILFERIMEDRARSAVASQTLLEPLAFAPSPESSPVLEEHLDELSSVGFQMEPFGKGTLLVRALPAVVGSQSPAEILEDIASALLSGDRPMADSTENAVALEVCKRAAIKAGQVMAHEEMVELIGELEQCASPRTCPHGRPTMIHLSAEQLARDFGRR
jgi:DNA mismatch repair protein MutL